MRNRLVFRSFQNDMARIIMADDDEIVCEVFRDALINAGHAVGMLDNGADALKVIRARRPDLVILDCNMPELPGILVLRQMRDSPDLFETPVLILTGRQASAIPKSPFTKAPTIT